MGGVPERVFRTEYVVIIRLFFDLAEIDKEKENSADFDD